MIYRFTFLLLFAFVATFAYAQPGNLVENPSFEERTDCIYNSGAVDQAPPWFTPTGGTPDVFHECAVVLEDPCPYPEITNLDPWFFGVPTNTPGCQEPQTGIGYAGLFFYTWEISGMDHREYIGVPLSETLVAGETYLVRFFVSLAKRSRYAVHAIQVLFTSYEISEPIGFWGVLDYEPQLSHTAGDYISDKDSWTEVSWEYTADGTEQYMYIGNFQSNAVIDTLFVLPESISPLWHYQGAYYYVDDVYVGTEILSVEQHSNLSIDLWPNPVVDVLYIETKSPMHRVSVYGIDGKQLFQLDAFGSGNLSVNVADFATGLYVVLVTDQAGNRASKKIVKR